MTSFKGPVPAGRKKKSIVHFLWHQFCFLLNENAYIPFLVPSAVEDVTSPHLPVLTPPSCGDRWTHAESFQQGRFSKRCRAGHLSQIFAINYKLPPAGLPATVAGPSHAPLCYHWLSPAASGPRQCSKHCVRLELKASWTGVWFSRWVCVNSLRVSSSAEVCS